MGHYFVNDNNFDLSNILDINILSINIKLYTSSGIFSKNSLDFGTSLLIHSTSPLIENKNKLLIDLGCGYGAVGIYFAKKNPNNKVIMLDINEKAIYLTNTNILYNQTEKNALAMVSNGLICFKECFEDNEIDYILFNPPIRAGKNLVQALFKECFVYLKKGGILFTVIRKQQGADTHINYLNTLFNKYRILNKKKGYLVAEFTKDKFTKQ